MRDSDESRFWAKVSLPDENGCMAWLAARDARDYGVFRLAGKTVKAHRVARALTEGPFPDGMVTDHLCRHAWCVAPAHLEPVTSQVNTLRGNGPAARNARKETCPRGHVYNAINVRGARICRKCA